MFNMGPGEILLILVFALLIFGPKRLPDIGRSIGKGMRELRRASTELRDEFEDLGAEPKTRTAPPRRAPGAGPPPPAENGAGTAPAGSSGNAPAARRPGDATE